MLMFQPVSNLSAGVPFPAPNGLTAISGVLGDFFGGFLWMIHDDPPFFWICHGFMMMYDTPSMVTLW
jgi:hypothetical protein